MRRRLWPGPGGRSHIPGPFRDEVQRASKMNPQRIPCVMEEVSEIRISVANAGTSISSRSNEIRVTDDVPRHSGGLKRSRKQRVDRLLGLGLQKSGAGTGEVHVLNDRLIGAGLRRPRRGLAVPREPTQRVLIEHE